MIGFNKTPAAVGFNKLPAPAAPAAAAAAAAAAAPAAPAAAPAAPFTDQLVAFCARATEGRPPSHGVAHMTAVRLNAERIFDALRASSAGKTDGTSAMMNDQTRRMVQAAAQFHDVADHKYVEEGQAAGGGFGVLEELQKHFSPKASASLVKVMAAVSFSKERALRAAAGAAEQPFAFEATLGAAGALNSQSPWSVLHGIPRQGGTARQRQSKSVRATRGARGIQSIKSSLGKQRMMCCVSGRRGSTISSTPSPELKRPASALLQIFRSASREQSEGQHLRV